MKDEDCYYCGEWAATRDHWLRAWAMDHLSAAKRRSYKYHATVPACRQCNCSLSSFHIPDLQERAKYLLWKYRRKLDRNSHYIGGFEVGIRRLKFLSRVANEPVDLPQIEASVKKRKQTWVDEREDIVTSSIGRIKLHYEALLGALCHRRAERLSLINHCDPFKPEWREAIKEINDWFRQGEEELRLNERLECKFARKSKPFHNTPEYDTTRPRALLRIA